MNSYVIQANIDLHSDEPLLLQAEVMRGQDIQVPGGAD